MFYHAAEPITDSVFYRIISVLKVGSSIELCIKPNRALFAFETVKQTFSIDYNLCSSK